MFIFPSIVPIKIVNYSKCYKLEIPFASGTHAAAEAALCDQLEGKGATKTPSPLVGTLHGAWWGSSREGQRDVPLHNVDTKLELRVTFSDLSLTIEETDSKLKAVQLPQDDNDQNLNAPKLWDLAGAFRSLKIAATSIGICSCLVLFMEIIFSNDLKVLCRH